MTTTRNHRTTHRHSRAQRIGRRVFGSILTLLIVVGITLLALFSFEQFTLRPLTEHLVEKATGRTFSIESTLDARLERRIIVVAGGIRLANADWGSDSDMLSIDRAEVAVDLLRLLKGAAAVDSVVIDGAQLLLEQDSTGRSNWALGPAQSSQTPSSQPAASDAEPAMHALPVIRSRLSAIEVTLIDPALSEPLELHFASIEHHGDQGETLQAGIEGQVKDRPFTLDAQIRPISQLLAAGAVQLDLQAASRSVKLDLEGEVDNLGAPRQVSAHLSLDVADLAQILATLGLPPFASGASELKASLLPSGDQHTLDLTAALAGLQLDAQARLQSLDSIDGASASLSAKGPDLAAVARLAGLKGLPAQPFSLHSSLALAGTLFTLGETRFDSGDIRLSAQGSMAQFPGLDDSNLQLRLSGGNYVELVELLGLTVPDRLRPEPYELTAGLEYNERQQQLFSAKLALADVEGKFDGKLIGFPGLVGSELDYRLTGRNDALLQQWLGRPTRIDGNYSLAGRVVRTGSGFDIDRADLTLGNNELKLTGKVGNEPLIADTELSLQFRGPNLAQIAGLAGYDGFVPAGDADITAAATVSDNQASIENLEARLGRNRLQASGQVNLADSMTASHVKLAASGKDIADVVPPAFHDFIHSGQSFEVTGELATNQGRLAIDALQARLGKVNLQASGSLSAQQPLADTAITFELNGPDLKAFIPGNLVPYEFRAERFAVSGGIALGASGLALDSVEAQIGEDRFAASGTVPLDTPTEGLALALSASGPNLAAVVPVDAEQLDLTELSYDLSTKLKIDGGILSLQALDFSTPRGNLTGGLSIALDDPRASGQFDLRAKGDNLQEFAPSTRDYQPAAVAFDLDTRGSWDAKTLSVEQGTLRLGRARIEASGSVSLPPDAIASQLVLSAHGDNLADLGNIKGLVFPNEAFSVDATLQGGADGLKIPEMVARFGASDLNGSLEITFAEKPDIVLRLKSELLDLAELLEPDQDSNEIEAEPQPANNDGRVIPQVKVPVKQLHAVNLEADIDLVELRMEHNDLRDIQIDASLTDGHLEVRNLQATATEGQLSAQFEAIAKGDRIVTRGELAGKDIVLGKAESQDPAISLPKQDLKLGFSTEGATIRDLAANLNGFAQLVGGDGRMQNSRFLSLFGSFFAELLSSINPFVTKEPYTTISCYAAYAEIVDGVAVIKPGAVMQTGKLNMFARGQVDLNSEKVALRFDTSARSGLGISVADFVNPFVGVSGTLASPKLGVDPENAMYEGSFAYATGGLSIVAKSLFNRWFGTKNPCARLQQEAAELQQEKQEAAAEEAAQQEETSATE